MLNKIQIGMILYQILSNIHVHDLIQRGNRGKKKNILFATQFEKKDGRFYLRPVI